MSNTAQQRSLAVHLWWRYTWRSIVFMLPIAIVVGILVAILAAMRSYLPSAGLTIGIALVTLAAIVVAVLVMGGIVRSKSFLKSLQSHGDTLQPFAILDGKPIQGPMPWSSAYGILWGIGWRSWMISLVLQILLHLVTQSDAMAPMLMSIILGQVGVIAAFYWLIKAPMGKTRIEMARDPSFISSHWPEFDTP